jgi:hypothetical protein
MRECSYGRNYMSMIARIAAGLIKHNIHYASFDGVTERSEVIAIASPFSALAARVWTQKPAVT